MGYTHYWKSSTFKSEEEKTKKFDKFFEVCRKLYENRPKQSLSAGGYYADADLLIANGQGEGEPFFGDRFLDAKSDQEYGRVVWFNGYTPKSSAFEDLSHETFMISEKKNEGDFCKTARKPYDLLVCACLIAAGKILGYQINTDGTLEDWKPAFEFYNSVMNTNQTPTKKFLNKK